MTIHIVKFVCSNLTLPRKMFRGTKSTLAGKLGTTCARNPRDLDHSIITDFPTGTDPPIAMHL